MIKEIKEIIPNIRIDYDFDSVPLSGKIRNAELMKIPYILVVGDKEEKENKVAVRTRGDKKIEAKKIDDFIKSINQEITERK